MGNYFNKFIQLFPCSRKPRPETRTVFVGNEIPESCEVVVPVEYVSNRVISSKYTAWNFVPKNLFEQFHRIANLYFLVVIFIEIMVNTSVSPWTSIAPLLFVVIVTAVKQGYEDWLRHKSDKEVNHQECLVVRKGQMEKVKAMHIQVGDIVKVLSNGDIPCDMVMLSSEDIEGQCYITTANLDGETNLKTFSCVSETRHLRTDEQFATFRATIECQQPITDLYHFTGRINVCETNDNVIPKPLFANNVLLRGARLKNTQFVYGCAIYTGQETKISLNSKYKSRKYSRVEKMMNFYLIVYLIILICYSIIWVCITLGFYSASQNLPDALWYIGGAPNFWTLSSAEQFSMVVKTFLSYMVLCNYVIPISMYVTVELQKFFGAMFFAWDVEMYDPLTNEPAKANTSDLNEELGQIQLLFTDKTGTLTENIMQFRQCSVDSVIYEEIEGRLCIRPDFPDIRPSPVRVLTPEMIELFSVMALCHTIHVEKNGNSSCEYEYQSSSPDEKALAEACQRYGIVYHGMCNGRMMLSINGRLHNYILHHTLDFDPTRKCMSVIVEDENGCIQLLCKGAETAIFEKSTVGDVDTVERHVNDFAVLGLRTLVMAKRVLTTEEFSEYDAQLNAAKTSLENREDKLAEVYGVIERDLQLLGATAVEDKLQDGVPDTISSLRQAGIQVWVLTGDKEETAVNISYSAGHLNHKMQPLSLTKQASTEECGATLESFDKLLTDSGRHGEAPQHALIVDGRSLTFALDSYKELLHSVCLKCVTVLCCRMSPIQKALVVRLMKSGKNAPTTAAIGDGANDVSMIQEAHVGLGIMGKEGRQAVRSSDYAFGRFRFLKRALLVHGHYFYYRVAILVQYFFYKNVAMIMAQLYFTFFSAFSAQTVYNGFFLMWYNTGFTAIPILLFGWLELHVKDHDLMQKPHLYLFIRNNKFMSHANFIKYNLIGLWHSLVFFFGPYFALAPGNSPFANGQEYGIYEFGVVVMTTCIITVHIKLMVDSYNFNLIIVGGFILSFAIFFFLSMIYCIMLWPVMSETVQLYYSMETMLGSIYIWLLMLLLIITALLPDILLRAIQDNFSPLFLDREPIQPPKSTRSDSLDDLLSNRAPTDRGGQVPASSGGGEDVPLSTITASYEKLRHRTPVAMNGDGSPHPEIIDWGTGTEDSYQSIPAVLLQSEDNGYDTVELNTANYNSPHESRRTLRRHGAKNLPAVEADTETYAYAYDNQVCTSEV